MSDYEQGKIYKLVSKKTDKIYIGSTKLKYLYERMGTHRFHYKHKNTIGYLSSFKILKYTDCRIVLIENYPCRSKKELRKREQDWIDCYKNICINEKKAYQSKNDRKEYLKKLDATRKPKLCMYCDVYIGSKQFARHTRTNKHKDSVLFFNKI
jgi:hypothetical protein